MVESKMSEFFGFRRDSVFWPVLLALLALILLNPMRVNHDCLVYLEMGRMLVEGKVPYIDFGEVNPPLIIYLNAIPPLFGKLVPINVVLIFLILVWGLIVWSTLSARRLLLNSGLGLLRPDVAVALLFWSLFSIWVYAQNDFGQRDYLFMLLFVPFFVSRWVRWEGGNISLPLAIGTGLAAAVGVCVKPHFILVAGLCELCWVCSHRRLRDLFQAETFAFGIAGLCYAAHFVFLPEAVKESIFQRWLPFIMATYHAYDEPLTKLLKVKTFWAAFTVGCVPFVIRSSRKVGLWRMGPSLSMLVIGSLLVYLWQHKGFTYHTAPYVGGALLLLGIATSEIFAFSDEPESGKSFRLRFPMSVGCAILFVAAVFLVTGAGLRSGGWTTASRADGPFSEIIAQHSQKGDTILTLTSSLVDSPLHTVLLMERRPAHRYFFTFWMGMLYAAAKEDKGTIFPYHSRSTAPPEEMRLIKELEEDLARFKPKLIFVHNKRGCQGCPPNFSIDEYADKIGLMGEISKHYRLLTTESGYSVYILNHPSSGDTNAG
jgi:hypothetical protein